MNYLLMNPLANNEHGEECALAAKEKLVAKFGEMEVVSVLEGKTRELIESLGENDNVVLFGGDGTLNHFVNDIEGLSPKCAVYLQAGGTGNDFMNDIKADVVDGLAQINKYVEHLPIVEVNGLKRRFINGIGYGIDGEACRVADEQKAAGKKDINYTSISIKLLMVDFKRPTATVIVDDGEEKIYKKVCLASAMKGGYYGGGMNIAPAQDRTSGLLSNVVVTGGTRFGILMLFPKIFKGEHVKNAKRVKIVTAKKITVKFDHPCALQIDGETVLNVNEFTAYCE